MMNHEFVGSFGGTTQLLSSLQTIELYVGSLMNAWGMVLIEDNRRGVMAGLDKNDMPVEPTKYRRSFTQAGIDPPLFVQSVKDVQTGRSWLVNVSGEHGQGFKPGAGNDLTTKRYKALSGPPLAPRGMASRIISNYTVEPIVASAGQYGVQGGWDDILNNDGVPFMPFHFEGSKGWIPGEGGLPKRDMNGLRKWGRDRAAKELSAWIDDVMTQQIVYFSEAGHAPDFVAWTGKGIHQIKGRRRGPDNP